MGAVALLPIRRHQDAAPEAAPPLESPIGRGKRVQGAIELKPPTWRRARAAAPEAIPITRPGALPPMSTPSLES